MSAAERQKRYRQNKQNQPAERRRRGDRERKREVRAAEREARQASLPAPPISSSGLAWFEEHFDVLPWELDWLEGVLQDGILYGALSVARANGKTTWCGAIGAAAVAPDGPLRVPGTAVVAVAASFGQAREVYDAALEVLQPYVDADPDDWRLLDSQRLMIEHRPTKTRLEVRAAEARTLHGIRKGRLFLLDEPAQMQRTAADKIWSAIRTSIGKVEGGRILVCGTKPADSLHWFSKLLEGGPATHVVDYSTGPDDDPFIEATWRKANPSIAYFPEMRRAIKIEADEAKRDGSLLHGFRALRLNGGVLDHEVAMLLEAGTWESVEIDLSPRQDGYALGVDLGGSAAMSSAAGYWWATGSLDAFAYFAEIPDLVERGRNDAVGDLYQVMHDREELLLHEGRVVSPGALIRAAVDRWGVPSVVIADRYREAELYQALADAGIRCAVAMRGMGYRDGGEDVRRFQRAVIGGHVHARRSLLLRSAIGEARTIADPAGNRKLAKAGEGSGRRALARDDAAAAAILAVAEGARRAERPTPRRRRHYVA